MVEYDIPVAKLEEACKLCPGLESPTIAPLQDDSWRSVKVMVKSSEVNDIMDNLHDIGGRAILVTEIKSCRL
jgi:ATP phosphoribosyltransferase